MKARQRSGHTLRTSRRWQAQRVDRRIDQELQAIADRRVALADTRPVPAGRDPQARPDPRQA